MLYELLFEPTLQIRTPSTCMTSNAGNYKTSRLDSRHKTIFAHIGRLDVATRQRSSLNMSNTTRIESARLQYKIHRLAFQIAKWCHAMWCRSAVENGQLSASLAQLKVGLIRGGAWRAVGPYGAKWCFENAMTLMNLPRSLSDEWMHGILGFGVSEPQNHPHLVHSGEGVQLCTSTATCTQRRLPLGIDSHGQEGGNRVEMAGFRIWKPLSEKNPTMDWEHPLDLTILLLNLQPSST